MLRILDRTFTSPAENLAFDDSLLAAGRETLRFWESPVYFVVLGRSGKMESEVNLLACNSDGIPVLRRSSGGGTVLQGQGCLNYTLVLSLDRRPELMNVRASYRILLERIAQGLALPGLQVRHTDILFRDKKISGNAQRRTKGWLLQHGTLLYGLNITLMERYVLEPARQPAHRNGRTHREFVTGLSISAREIQEQIMSACRRF